MNDDLNVARYILELLRLDFVDRTHGLVNRYQRWMCGRGPFNLGKQKCTIVNMAREMAWRFAQITWLTNLDLVE